MKLTVIGKYGPYAPALSGTSCYLITTNSQNFVLDFGYMALSKLQKHLSIKDIDGIILSHYHYDHFCDLLPLAYYLQLNQIKMNLYLPNVPCIQLELLKTIQEYNLFLYDEKTYFNIKGTAFNFYKMSHTVPSFAVKIMSENTSFLYSGDTSYCDALCNEANECTNLLLDIGGGYNENAPHLSFLQAEQIAESSHANTLCTHLNPSVEPPQLKKCTCVKEDFVYYLK